MFWYNVVCVRDFWLDDDAIASAGIGEKPASDSIRDRFIGRVVLQGGKFTRHTGSHTEVIRVVTTEADKIAALREFCGVNIDVDDIQYIRNRAAELVTNV